MSEEWSSSEEQSSSSSSLFSSEWDSDSELGTAHIAEEVSDDEEGKKKPLELPIEHRLSLIMQILMMIRFTFRGYFGEKSFNNRGHFVENQMVPLIYQYADFFDYPRGNAEMRGHSNWIYAACVSSECRYLYTGSQDCSIIRWDLCDHTLLGQWHAHSSAVMCLAIHSTLLCSGSHSSEVRLWDGYTHELKHTWQGHFGAVHSVDFSSDGCWILSGADDNIARVWSVNTGELLYQFVVGVRIRSMAFIQGRKKFLAGAQDGSLQLWTVHKPRVIWQSDRIEDTGYGNRIVMNCDRSLFLLCNLTSYDARNSFVFQWPSLEKFKDEPLTIQMGCFHPRNPYLLATVQSRSISMVNVLTGEMLGIIANESRQLLDLCFTHDGFRLIAVKKSRVVSIYDTSRF